VLTGPDGVRIGAPNQALLDTLQGFDAVLVAGQAKSHCVAWTVSHLLDALGASSSDPALARKVYLLEDCTSPVVVPGADYTEPAEAAFRRFAEAGMHLIRSTDPEPAWLSGIDGNS
jgi:nicotinamidase-related amidase